MQLCSVLLLVLPVLSSPIEEIADSGLSKRITCNRDNLLRCFDPTATAAALTRSSATAFCSSFLSIPVVTSTISTETSTTTTTTATEYTTTTLPLAMKRAANTNLLQCTTAYGASRLSSACSCLNVVPSTEYVTATSTDIQTSTTTATSTATATPSPRCPSSNTNILANPGFESGLTSWSFNTYGANTPPSAFGAVSSGYNSATAFSVSASNAGTGAILSQMVGGLIPGVTYTFAYRYQYAQTATVASSISCGLSGAGMSSQSVTNGGPLDTWMAGPSSYGETFKATGRTGTLQCFFVATGGRGPITWKVDNFYIGC
ncbi:hypothetical protein LZ554_002939 [Drepanopeziza brunnea f. sp. 'monogermtubi']|nr:hypothetical protein LZ554_002939 [Drepanopeziza brunnea f. sp. 'monogermtubi']